MEFLKPYTPFHGKSNREINAHLVMQCIHRLSKDSSYIKKDDDDDTILKLPFSLMSIKFLKAAVCFHSHTCTVFKSLFPSNAFYFIFTKLHHTYQ